MFWCVPAAGQASMVPAMENITPPMPAKRALAAPDQPEAPPMGIVF
jgi:hypothetical protein